MGFFERFSNKGNDEKNFGTTETKSIFVKSIDEITEIFADKINDIILKEEFYKAAIFLGGEFFVEYIDEKTYTHYCKFYFQKRDDSTYNLETKKQRVDIGRLAYEARRELETKKVIKFEIPEPSEEVRRKYTLSVD